MVDCAALSADQLERALFGDGQGNGLVAEAVGGSLFLDEVCSLSFFWSIDMKSSSISRNERT